MSRATKSKISHYLNAHKIRMAICAVLAMVLFITPVLTQAQYKWTLNGYTVLQAKEFYFNSNYLIPGGYMYTTGVWNGSDSPMQTIEIQNYENALLCNKTGEDLYYKLSWSIESYDPQGNPIGQGYIIDTESGTTLNSGYTINKVQKNYSSEISHESTSQATYGPNDTSCTGKLIGTGTPKKDTFSFEIKKPTYGEGEAALEWTAPEDSYILVHLSAYNTKSDEDDTPSDSYYREIKCTFKFSVTSAEGFVNQFNITETNNSKDIVLDMGTGAVPDMDAQSQTIYVWWRKDRLQVNPVSKLFTTMYNAGNYKANEKVTIESVDYNYCLLIITGLGSMSERILKMYKLTDSTAAAPFDNRSSLWFTESNQDILIGKNVRPENGIPAGVIIGYYILTTDSSSGNNSGGNTGDN